mgnify:CR=1 FL=1
MRDNTERNCQTLYDFIRGFQNNCSSVEKFRLEVRHAQRRVQNYDAVNTMAAHSILFMDHLYFRPLICVKSIAYTN